MTLSVEYFLEPQDVSAFRRFMTSRVRGGRRQSWIILVFFGLLLLLWLFSAVAKGDLRALVGVLAPIGIVVALIAFFVWRAMRKASAEEKKRLPVRQRVEISEEGVAQNGELGSTTFPWKVVHDIRSNDDHLFILQSPYSAVVVPARAFASSAAFKEFVEKALEFRGVQMPARVRRDS